MKSKPTIEGLEAEVRKLRCDLRRERELSARLRAAKDYQAKKRLAAEREIREHFCDH